MRFIISGGGTGGHIYPALAIADGLRSRHPTAEILYAGTTNGLEYDLVRRAGYRFYAVSAAGLQRRIAAGNLVAMWRAARGFAEAWVLVSRFKPDVVVGTGGYVCGPVVLAAVCQRVPTLIHEQNAFPGLTNRILSRFASCTALTFADAIRYLPRKARVRVTGLPVRPEVLGARREEARACYGLGDIFTVVSFGGSRGARTINKAMVEVCRVLKDDPAVRLYHATGRAQYDAFLEAIKDARVSLAGAPNIKVEPYFYDIARLLAAADLVVSRAGASTIAEITALGRPSILVPYPFATGNHQEYNARALVRRGAAVLLPDRELTGDVLLRLIEELRQDVERRQRMAQAARALGKPDALERLLGIIDQLADRRS
ncbi:MAG: undecaprenyldiphospho-muramoylpentapeptide beta-N-acetylglucosaminyltransferase [Desulfotomaculales bacterium]